MRKLILRSLRRARLYPCHLVPTRCMSEKTAKHHVNNELFTKVPASSLKPKRLVPIRGYMYLPGNQSPDFPTYLKDPREDFPLGVRCSAKEEFTGKDWALAIRDFIDEYLPKYKGIVFRGVPLKDATTFNNFVQDTGYTTVSYKFGTGLKNSIVGDVYGTGVEPSPYVIEMHNEGSYSPYKLIRKVFLFCQSPAAPKFGGENPICKTDRLMTSLDQNFISKLKAKQIRYLRIASDKKKNSEVSWQSSLIAETKQEAEADMKRMGVDWRWKPDDSLVYWYNKSAFLNHPETGEELWFNQATTNHRSYCDHLTCYVPSPNFEDYEAGFHAQYGDGTEIEDEYLTQIRALSWQEAVGVRLEAGDLLVLDNLHCQHGRMNYHGIRKLFVSLTLN